MNLLREVGSLIEHGNQDPFDFKVRIPLTTDLADRLDELGDTLQGKILALDGDQNAVGRHEGVYGQQIHSRRAIDQNEIVIICDRMKQITESTISALFLGKF